MNKEKTPVRTIPTETYFALIRQQLAEHGQAYVRVSGTSMLPLLRHLRDGVILVPPQRIRRGDIVLFDRKNGRYALHRVVGKKKDGFAMAGDHQRYVEQNLPYDQIVGVVTVIDREGKRISTENIFQKIFAWSVTCRKLLRIYVWKVVGPAAEKIRRHGNRQKGAG